MSSHPGFGAAASSLPSWSLLFAREPEQDLDFDDGPEAPEGGEGMQPDEPEEPSGGKKWIVLLVVIAVAGGLYFAWDTGLLSTLTGPADNAPMTSSTPGQPDAAPPPPEPPPQTGGETPGPPQPQVTPPSPPMPPRTDTRPAPPVVAVPPPAFGEGQKVSVAPDPTLPAAAVSLHGDPGETRPGPIVSPATVLTVVDGEFRNNGWVYTVRTPDGTTGWVSERRLRVAKP